MSEERWDIAAAATGIGAVVLLLVSTFMVPTPPKIDDSASAVRSYFADHASALRASGYVLGLGIALLFWFLGSLRAASSFAIAPLVGALAVIILRHGGLPKWLGWFSAAFAVYEVVEGLCVAGTSGALAPQGAVNVAGLFIFALWGLLTSGSLMRALGARTRAAP